MDNYTLGEWMQQWYEIYKKPKLSKLGTVPVEVAIRLHVPEELKNKQLQTVTVLDLDRAISLIPPSRSQKQLYDVLRASMRKAYALDLIQRDISVMIEPVRYRMKKGNALTSEELDLFLIKIRGHKLEYLFKFYVLTGCRRHEALTLKWEDIDTVHEVLLLRGTKTDLSYRCIPLTSELHNLLQVIPRSSEEVFPFLDDYVTKTFKKFCPEHKLHDLRHTFATICAENNVHPSACQKLLGHSKIDTTMRIYTHVQNSFVAKEVKKIDFSKLK